jgi:hypothetical protein
VALRVSVSPPTGWRGHLAGLLEPLSDGLVAAMHAHDGDTGPIADRASTIEPDLTPAEFRALLHHPRQAALGRVRLVITRGATLQWLPADDRIVALDTRLSHDHRPGTVLVEALDANPR